MSTCSSTSDEASPLITVLTANTYHDTTALLNSVYFYLRLLASESFLSFLCFHVFFISATERGF